MAVFLKSTISNRKVLQGDGYLPIVQRTAISLVNCAVSSGRASTFPTPQVQSLGAFTFVKGVASFRIEDNTFGLAGGDAICIWHSSHGVIVRNRGGGNGENTVDVKDSHDVLITDNQSDNDTEYNIVVHGVDSNDLTYNIVVERNRRLRGGQGGKLLAGIALQFVRKSRVRRNRVEDAYGEGIVVGDAIRELGNEVSHTLLINQSAHSRRHRFGERRWHASICQHRVGRHYSLK